MERYRNTGGDSGVYAYEIGSNYIKGGDSGETILLFLKSPEVINARIIAAFTKLNAN